MPRVAPAFTTMSILTLSVVCASGVVADDAKSRPNIVYVLADDLGCGDVSCANPKSAWRTPAIDRLAAAGMRFSDAHSGSAVCTPTRYGVLTGRYAWRTRLARGVLNGNSPALIDATRVTVASYLREHGYHTAVIGKWHLGWAWTRRAGARSPIDFAKPIAQGPTELGFDESLCITASLDMPPYVYVDGTRATAIPDHESVNRDQQGFWRKGVTAPDFVHERVLAQLTDRAVALIESRAAAARQGQPFFLYLPLTAPHTPIVPAAEFRGRSGAGVYGDFVLQVDATVDRVSDAIARSGLENDTLIVFTSDNGCSPRADFDALAKLGHRPSSIYRGAKADIYEGGHRVPFIASWPGHIATGAVSDQTICLTDLLRTCADIVGDPLPAVAGEDSVSLWPILRGDPVTTAIREATVHHSINGSFAIRQGRWKLALCPGSGGWSAPRPQAARRQGLPPIQLFDLRDDPGERHNVAAEQAEIVARLWQTLDRYVRDGRSTPGPQRANDRDVTIPALPELLPRTPIADETKMQRIVVGTFTRGSTSEGIYSFDLDLERDRVLARRVTRAGDNPAFLARHPTRPILYVVHGVDRFGERATGGVSAYHIAPESGQLTLLNRVSSGGAGPCHLAVDRGGRFVLVANYSGGSVSSLAIQPDGSLAEPHVTIVHTGSSIDPHRQRQPHAHAIGLDAANRFALSSDLGIDELLVYRFDADTGVLSAHDPASVALTKGAGPRHFAWHPSGRFVYVINELNSTVTGLGFDASRGRLKVLASTSTLPNSFRAADATNTGGEIAVHPNGRHLYASTRGHDSIAVFDIDADSGRLSPLEHVPAGGRVPRHFAIDPTGRWLLVANRASDQIVAFGIDPVSGRLHRKALVIDVPSPVCVRFMGR